MRNCDGFVILKITDNKEIMYRLFTCTAGGYLSNDSWRVDSGIVSIEEDDEYNGDGSVYFIYGVSGSVYQVHEDQFGKLTDYGSSILNEVVKSAGDAIDVECISIKEYLDEQK